MRGKRDTLGKRLLRLRTKAGVGVSDLAKIAGLKSPSHIGLIERGVRKDIAASTALALARVLGASVEWLVSGEGDEPSEAVVKAAIGTAQAVVS
jgi:transcriptional regulator with XRE-family HTH domain